MNILFQVSIHCSPYPGEGKLKHSDSNLNIICSFVQLLYLDYSNCRMKYVLIILFALGFQSGIIAQAFFPIDESSGKVFYTRTETIPVSKSDKYLRAKTWFINYYRISSFEDHFKVTKRGKPVMLIENKNKFSITGKCGFYIMHPSESSGLIMNQTFVTLTMTLSFTDSGYKNHITDLICYTANTTAGNNMRPPEFGLEAFNELRLNRQEYVQKYIIPQVTNSVRKIQDELSRNIRYGNLTEARL